MTNIRDIGDGAARLAYRCGDNPVAHAEKRVAIVIATELQVIVARAADSGAFPAYPQGAGIEPLSRRILGLMLDIGWTAPDIDLPTDLIEGVPGALEDLEEP